MFVLKIGLKGSIEGTCNKSVRILQENVTFSDIKPVVCHVETNCMLERFTSNSFQQSNRIDVALQTLLLID